MTVSYRCLEHGVEGEVGAADLEHIFFEDEVLAPLVLHVRLELRAEGAVVVETRDAAVDLETGRVEELLLQQVLTLLPLVLLS